MIFSLAGNQFGALCNAHSAILRDQRSNPALGFCRVPALHHELRLRRYKVPSPLISYKYLSAGRDLRRLQLLMLQKLQMDLDTHPHKMYWYEEQKYEILGESDAVHLPHWKTEVECFYLQQSYIEKSAKQCAKSCVPIRPLGCGDERCRSSKQCSIALHAPQ